MLHPAALRGLEGLFTSMGDVEDSIDLYSGIERMRMVLEVDGNPRPSRLAGMLDGIEALYNLIYEDLYVEDGERFGEFQGLEYDELAERREEVREAIEAELEEEGVGLPELIGRDLGADSVLIEEMRVEGDIQLTTRGMLPPMLMATTVSGREATVRFFPPEIELELGFDLDGMLEELESLFSS